MLERSVLLLGGFKHSADAQPPICCLRDALAEFWSRMQIHLRDVGMDCGLIVCRSGLFPSDAHLRAIVLLDVEEFIRAGEGFKDALGDLRNSLIIYLPAGNAGAGIADKLSKRFPNAIFIVAPEFPRLVDALILRGCEPPSPEDRAWLTYKYIMENLDAVRRPRDVLKRICDDPRRIRDEFRYFTGGTLEQALGKERFNLLLETTYNRSESGNYYALAMETHFKSEQALEMCVRNKTGMTLKQWEKEIKSLNHEEFSAYRRELRKPIEEGFLTLDKDFNQVFYQPFKK